MKNKFKFKVAPKYDANNLNFLYTATREDGEEVFLVTWIDEGEECSEIYHEKTVETYINDGSWIVQ